MNELAQPPARRVFIITPVVTFLGFLDTHLLIPVMALYASHLGAGVGVIGLIIGLYSIVNTPANILFGRLVGRVGYKAPLVVGLAGDALSMFFYSLCRSPVYLALVRVFHGLSGALVGPATMSATARHAQRAKRGRAMGWYGMSIAAATLVGYGLSGVIVARWDYQGLFLFGAGLLAAGVGLGLLLPGDRAKVAASSGTAAGGTWRQVKTLLRRRGLILAYGAIFAQYFAFGGVVTLLPVYIESLGMGAFHMGMMLAAFAVMFMVAQFPAGVLADRVGRLIPIAGSLMVSIVVLMILPSLTTFPLLVLVMAIYGAAYGMLFPSVSALVVDYSLPPEHGMTTGFFHALLTAGVALGAPVIGGVGEVVGVGTGLMFTPVLLVLALVFTLISLKRL